MEVGYSIFDEIQLEEEARLSVRRKRLRSDAMGGEEEEASPSVITPELQYTITIDDLSYLENILCPVEKEASPSVITPELQLTLSPIVDLGSFENFFRDEEPTDDLSGFENLKMLYRDEEEEASPSVITPELQYTISPNGTFRASFKNWQKGKFLGSGSFGAVHEAVDESGCFFAVKEVSLLDQGSQGKQSIEQEISLLRKFHHENIVRYLGTDSDDGKLYIFLELVTKGSLAKLYKEYELQDSQVSAYTRQILSGLNYLHEQKVVHRDIKCANILVDASGSVKLADFGLAKVTTTLNDIKSCKGTAHWMAPEVVKNQAEQGYGFAVDIWSLGCTVLEMLTRKIPYHGLEWFQAVFRIGRGERPEIPNTLSAEARDFILKCLQVNPNDRPTAAQLLEHPFLKRPTSMNSALLSPHHNCPKL